MPPTKNWERCAGSGKGPDRTVTDPADYGRPRLGTCQICDRWLTVSRMGAIHAHAPSCRLTGSGIDSEMWREAAWATEQQ